jgi:molybdopterin converting factor small subunit
MEGRLLFAANAEYAGPDFVLHAGDELTLITPVSGGATS